MATDSSSSAASARTAPVARFRPCIDLHGGKVKQIVGSTLSDDPNKGPVTNFEAKKPAADFAAMYRADGLDGGHVIMLGPGNEEAAESSLRAYPGGMQVGGGINPSNTKRYLDAGASHVIVTSYVFTDGRLDQGRLAEMVDAAGRSRLVLDLSCRRREPGGPFFVVTDRWQKFTSLELTEATLRELAGHCAEFLVHAVDVEGKQSGIETELVELLGRWSPIPVTYVRPRPARPLPTHDTRTPCPPPARTRPARAPPTSRLCPPRRVRPAGGWRSLAGRPRARPHAGQGPRRPGDRFGARHLRRGAALHVGPRVEARPSGGVGRT